MTRYTKDSVFYRVTVVNALLAGGTDQSRAALDYIRHSVAAVELNPGDVVIDATTSRADVVDHTERAAEGVSVTLSKGTQFWAGATDLISVYKP